MNLCFKFVMDLEMISYEVDVVNVMCVKSIFCVEGYIVEDMLLFFVLILKV